jgi:hypothetical protein
MGKPRLTERVEILLTPEMKEELDRKAYDRVVSTGALIREAIMLLLDQWAAFDERGQGTE